MEGSVLSLSAWDGDLGPRQALPWGMQAFAGSLRWEGSKELASWLACVQGRVEQSSCVPSPDPG